MTKLEVNYFFIIELYCKVYIYNFNQEEMLCIYIKDTFILVELNRHRQKTKYTLKKKKKKDYMFYPVLLLLVWTIPFLLENWSHIHDKTDLSSHISEH